MNKEILEKAYIGLPERITIDVTLEIDHPAFCATAVGKVTNAVQFRPDEAIEVYRRIGAPTLCVVASDDSLGLWWKGRYTLEEFRERIAHVPQLRHAMVDDAGHMLHHDQPEALARLIEDFLREA